MRLRTKMRTPKGRSLTGQFRGLAAAGMITAVLTGWLGSSTAVYAGGEKAPTIVNVWPGFAPGETTMSPGTDSPGTSNYGPINSRTNITEPQLYIYQPPNADGTARPVVIVCPGGGYVLCTADIEGEEIARWLNSMGYVAAVLYYRVPNWQPQYLNRLRPLQDAQRSIAFLRHNAAAYGIDPHHVGMLGMSAGGHLTARTSSNFTTLSYTPVDAADSESVRPDFSVLAYPAYLIDNNDNIEPEVEPIAGMPSFFLTESKDDSFYPNVPKYAAALDTAAIPETHYIYNVAGHGYGVRVLATADGNDWIDEAEKWLAAKAPATPHSNCAILPYASTTPVIDGTVDSVWSNSADYALLHLVGTVPSGGSLAADWKGSWDNTNLYLLVNVTDNELITGPTSISSDAVEVYVDATDSKTSTYGTGDSQYVFGWNAPNVAEYVNGTQVPAPAGIVSATARTANGYETEIALPWSVLGRSPGNMVGLDIHVDDTNSTSSARQATLIWNAVADTEWTDPSKCGTALILPTPGTPVPNTPSSLLAKPGNAVVALSWTGNSPATSYNIYRGTSSGNEGATPIGSSITTTFKDTTAVNGTAYFYQVTAVNSAGETEASNQSSATPVVPPTLTSITVTPNRVTGGDHAVVTLTLTGPAPVSGTQISLESEDVDAAKVTPITVTVPAGSTSATASVKTYPVTSNTTLVLTANSGHTHTCHLTVLAPSVKKVEVLPTKVIGSAGIQTGTVTLNAVAATATRIGIASNSSNALVPSYVIVQAGKSTATFQCKTRLVASVETATITATGSSNASTYTITIKPSTPPSPPAE